MEGEITLGEIYDGISDNLAKARNYYCNGDNKNAFIAYRDAELEFAHKWDYLLAFPGFDVLKEALSKTRAVLLQNGVELH